MIDGDEVVTAIREDVPTVLLERRVVLPLLNLGLTRDDVLTIHEEIVPLLNEELEARLAEPDAGTGTDETDSDRIRKTLEDGLDPDDPAAEDDLDDWLS